MAQVKQAAGNIFLLKQIKESEYVKMCFLKFYV